LSYLDKFFAASGASSLPTVDPLATPDTIVQRGSGAGIKATSVDSGSNVDLVLLRNAVTALTIGAATIVSALNVQAPYVEVQQSSVTTTQSLGALLWNSTAASGGVPQQYSPVLSLLGAGWATGAAASKSAEWAAQVQPLNGSTIVNRLALMTNVAAAGYQRFIYLSVDNATAAVVEFAKGLASVMITQEDQTAASTGGRELIIKAQNATGTTSTGGALTLSSGTGTSGEGRTRLQVGGTTRFEANSTGIGLFGVSPVARSAAYTVANPTTDRALNVTGDTLAQGLAVLGTLILDLQLLGAIG